jgi:hypothetical protein
LINGLIHNVECAQSNLGRTVLGISMTIENISRRRVFWLAAAAMAVPAATLVLSDARAQSDQAPAADTMAPKKKTKSTKSKTKKTKPATTTTDPASAPAAAPK